MRHPPLLPALLLLLLCASASVLLSSSLLAQRVPAHPGPPSLQPSSAAPPSLPSSACLPALHPRVLVYNRLEKTASSTLYSIINALAGANNFSHVRLPGNSFHDAGAARAALQAALESGRLTLLSEHFAFPEAPEDGRVAYMQLLRQPVERCISWYYWSRYSWENPWTAGNLAAYGNGTLDECLAQPGWAQGCLNCPPLHQVQSFCGADGGPCFQGSSLSPEQVLGRAWANLQQHYPVVGLTEQLEGSLSLLEAAFPDFFAGATRLYRQPGFSRARVLQGRAAQYVLPSAASRALLQGHLEGEGQLYERVRARWGEQVECLRRRGLMSKG